MEKGTTDLINIPNHLSRAPSSCCVLRPCPSSIVHFEYFCKNHVSRLLFEKFASGLDLCGMLTEPDRARGDKTEHRVKMRSRTRRCGDNPGHSERDSGQSGGLSHRRRLVKNRNSEDTEATFGGCLELELELLLL